MRLIDADKILYFKGKDIVGEDAYMTQKEIIDEMPTIDARPIRHGYWKRTSGSYVEWYECSECGSKASVFWGANSLTNYCPHCGAKMDEVEKKEIKKICILSNGTLKEEYDIPNVIRCKDCKYWDDDIDGYCVLKDSFNWEVDDFCSRGEKK